MRPPWGAAGASSERGGGERAVVVRTGGVSGERLDLDDVRREAFAAVTSAFASLGRICLAIDSEFRIRHVSPSLDDLLGAGAAARHEGRPVEDLLGPELFGAAGPMRSALAAGKRREGWRAWVKTEPEGSQLVSVSAAPLLHPTGACDPEAAYLVVLRPAEDEEEVVSGGAPTACAGIIARSRPMAEVLRLVERLQHSDVSVLVTGESGVGKGIVARAIHANSLRRDGPFVSVNCGALPEALLESELFGHVRGAFTGAVRDRVGRFEAAARGTLFLDEVGDLPLHLQSKLLRVLQERLFERVGESQPIAADVRVIAATHRDLRRAVEEGRFREDLYYRLRVFPIEIPPLRERREDIEPLARHLLAHANRRAGRALELAPDALRALLAHGWPGNVRELENALEYAATVSAGPRLRREDLPREVAESRVDARQAGGERAEAPAEGKLRRATLPAIPVRPASQRRGAPTREEILAALDAHRWRMAQASRELGVSRTTLWRWMRELGLAR